MEAGKKVSERCERVSRDLEMAMRGEESDGEPERGVVVVEGAAGVDLDGVQPEGERDSRPEELLEELLEERERWMGNMV